MVGPQATRNRVVAIDPYATRSDVAWGHRLGGMNDDVSQFGLMPYCDGVGGSTESKQKA